MIEKTLLSALERGTNVQTFMEVPENPPQYFITIERTGGGQRSFEQCAAVVAVQSYAPTLLEAAELNDEVIGTMREIQFTEDEVISCILNSSYNYTDPDSKRYRYQAVFDLVYFA